MKHIWKIIIILFICAAVFFFAYNALNASTFPAYSRINHVDCSNLTAQEAADALIKNVDMDEMSILKDDERVGYIKPHYHFDSEALTSELSLLIKKSRINPVLWYKLTQGYKIPVTIKDDSCHQQMKRRLEKILGTKYTVKTADAYLDYDELKIVKEVYGDDINFEKLEKYFADEISKGAKSFVFESNDFYNKPEILSDNPSLTSELEFCKKYLTGGMSINIRHKEISIPNEKLRWVIVPKNDEAEVSTPGAEKLLDWLQDKYDLSDTVSVILHGRKYSFEDRGDIYAVDASKTIDSIVEAAQDKLNGGNSVANIYYTGKGTDFTKNFIEVDISKQRLYFYKDGKCVMSTDVVTGKNGHSTPTGAFSILWKETNTTLRGREDDGRKYASKVSYWMPLTNEGIGLHDATWRYYFGGEIYKYNGSHGCINMPLGKARTLFNNVSSGYPVFIH